MNSQQEHLNLSCRETERPERTKQTNLYASPEKLFFFDLQKNRSQKLSMLEEKQGQFWNLHQIPHKT